MLLLKYLLVRRGLNFLFLIHSRLTLALPLSWSHRAYIFDNSQEEAQWVAEVSEDVPAEKTFIFHTDVLPMWFEKAVMAKLPK